LSHENVEKIVMGPLFGETPNCLSEGYSRKGALSGEKEGA